VNDITFEIEFDIIVQPMSTTRTIIAKVKSTQYVWQIYKSNTNRIYFYLNTNSSNYIGRYTAILSIGSQYKIRIVYDGSKSVDGISFYINNVLSTTTQSVTGTYTGMNTNTCSVSIGKYGEYDLYYLDGYLRNLKIKKNNQLVFFTPLQDSTAVSKDRN